MIDADRYRHTGRTYVNISGALQRPVGWQGKWQTHFP
jgi:hypothetical protein